LLQQAGRGICPPLVGIHGGRLSGAAVIADDRGELSVDVGTDCRAGAICDNIVCLGAHAQIALLSILRPFTKPNRTP